jgi:hypothetical protein
MESRADTRCGTFLFPSTEWFTAGALFHITIDSDDNIVHRRELFERCGNLRTNRRNATGPTGFNRSIEINECDTVSKRE